jgi:hypothetical protein
MVIPLIVIGTFVAVVFLLLGSLLAFLTVNEYRPGEVEIPEIRNPADAEAENRIRILSWNIGYSSLDVA